jgi:hypothetical protein
MKKLDLVVGEKMQAIIDKVNSDERSKAVNDLNVDERSYYDNYLEITYYIAMYNHIVDCIGRDIRLWEAIEEFASGIGTEEMLNKYYIRCFVYGDDSVEWHLVCCYGPYQIEERNIELPLDKEVRNTHDYFIADIVYKSDTHQYRLMALNHKRIKKVVMKFRDVIKSLADNIDCELLIV